MEHRPRGRGVKLSHAPAWLFRVPKNAEDSVCLVLVLSLYPHRRFDGAFTASDQRKKLKTFVWFTLRRRLPLCLFTRWWRSTTLQQHKSVWSRSVVRGVQQSHCPCRAYLVLEFLLSFQVDYATVRKSEYISHINLIPTRHYISGKSLLLILYCRTLWSQN